MNNRAVMQTKSGHVIQHPPNPLRQHTNPSYKGELPTGASAFGICNFATLSIEIISLRVAVPIDGIAIGCSFCGGVEVGPAGGLCLSGHYVFECAYGILIGSTVSCEVDPCIR